METRLNVFQIADTVLTVDHNDPSKDRRNICWNELSMDNLVFQGSIVAFQHNQLDCRVVDMPLSDQALYHLINVGARDMLAIDKPWDASTCSMRFATCLADHLWVMVAREQQRAHANLFPFLMRKLIYL